jgi:hypothetical protein
MFIIFVEVMGNVHKKKFILASQTANSAFIVLFYGDCVKMYHDFALNFGNKRTGCCIMAMHCLTFPFFFLTKDNMAVIPHPPYLFLFPRLKIKLKGCHFGTTEVIEAE